MFASGLRLRISVVVSTSAPESVPSWTCTTRRQLCSGANLLAGTEVRLLKVASRKPFLYHVVSTLTTSPSASEVRTIGTKSCMDVALAGHSTATEGAEFNTVTASVVKDTSSVPSDKATTACHASPRVRADAGRVVSSAPMPCSRSSRNQRMLTTVSSSPSTSLEVKLRVRLSWTVSVGEVRCASSITGAVLPTVSPALVVHGDQRAPS